MFNRGGHPPLYLMVMHTIRRLSFNIFFRMFLEFFFAVLAAEIIGLIFVLNRGNRRFLVHRHAAYQVLSHDAHLLSNVGAITGPLMNRKKTARYIRAAPIIAQV